MKRKMQSLSGDITVEVVEHIILANFWEYYVLESASNTDRIKFCYVCGAEDEMGDVDMDEIRPYVRMKTTNLNELLAPEGWRWV